MAAKPRAKVKKATPPTQKKRPTKAASKDSAPKKVAKSKVLAKAPAPVPHGLKISAPEVYKVAFTTKEAKSVSPSDMLYRLRTFVGWSAFVALTFAGLSMLSEYSTPGVNDISRVPLQASIIGADTSTDATQASATLAATPTLSVAQKDDVTLVAVGDIMLARTVEKKMRTLKDYTYPFIKVKDRLAASDLTFANLESPIFPGTITTPAESTTFRADEAAVGGLTASGIDLVSLANNHTMNYRVAGLQTTLKALATANIKPVGAGQNITEAHTPVLTEVKGHKIAFLAYNDPNIAPRRHGEATDTAPGIAKMDTELLKQDIARAKTMGADIIIVSMHAGVEYKKEPTQFQKDFAHTAIDSGANLVIGHHPHTVEPVERYGKGVILYSLGNFVFDQTFSEDVKRGLFATIIFKANGEIALEFSPVVIDNMQPRITEGQERVDLLKALGIPETL